MRLKFKTVFWIAAAVGVAVMLAIAFRPQAVPVDVAHTSRGPMVVTVRDEGRTRVREEYIVSSPVAGRLLRVDVEPGDHVHAGDDVAWIVQSAPSFLDARAEAEARAAVESAEAALASAEAERRRAEAEIEFARTELERVEDLRERDLAAPDALDRARLRLRVTEAALGAAEEGVRSRRADLDAARSRLVQPGSDADDGARVPVTSPVNGRILAVARESSGVIAAGTEIMTLGDPRDLEIVVEMLSTDAVAVRRGAEVFIEDFGRDEPALHGRVRLVEPYGFTKISALGVEEQRVNVIVDFVDPVDSWSMLEHGYRVEAAVVTWSAEDVLRVPVAALFRSGGQWAVFRVDGGTARLTPIEIGRSNGDVAEVLSGVEADETVVLYPGERIDDGVRVRPRE